MAFPRPWRTPAPAVVATPVRPRIIVNNVGMSAAEVTKLVNKQASKIAEDKAESAVLPILYGTTDPEGVVAGLMHQMYRRTDTGETWTKQSGNGTTTGWV